MKNLLISVVVSTVITVGGIWFYDRNYATRIVVFDMKRYVEGLKADYMAGKLSREELKARLSKLKTSLSEHPSNTITLLKEVVVSGEVEEVGPGVSHQE